MHRLHWEYLKTNHFPYSAVVVDIVLLQLLLSCFQSLNKLLDTLLLNLKIYTSAPSGSMAILKHIRSTLYPSSKNTCSVIVVPVKTLAFSLYISRIFAGCKIWACCTDTNHNIEQHQSLVSFDAWQPECLQHKNNICNYNNADVNVLLRLGNWMVVKRRSHCSDQMIVGKNLASEFIILKEYDNLWTEINFSGIRYSWIHSS